jgi:hypothetical protein
MNIYPLFEAVLTLVRRARAKRAKLAHWLWAISPDIDDALLLIDPDGAMDYHTALAEHLAKHPQHMDFIEAKDVPPLDLKTVFIYREKEFQEITYELNGAWNLTTTGRVARVVEI